MKEARILARLAWNGWPDTPEARKIIADHEARDAYSAEAWDRVIEVVRKHLDDVPVAQPDRAMVS